MTVVADSPIFEQLVREFYALDEASTNSDPQGMTTIDITPEVDLDEQDMLPYNAAKAYVGMTRSAWSRVLAVGNGPKPDVERTMEVQGTKPYVIRLWHPRTLDSWMEGRKPKVTSKDLPEIHRRRTAGESLTSIARTYGVSPSYISHLLAGRRGQKD